jgi:hypothetical protein
MLLLYRQYSTIPMASSIRSNEPKQHESDLTETSKFGIIREIIFGTF